MPRDVTTSKSTATPHAAPLAREDANEDLTHLSMRERLLHPSKKQAANANPTAGTSAYLLSEYLQPKLLAQIQALKAENKVLQERKEKAENAAIRWYDRWRASDVRVKFLETSLQKEKREKGVETKNIKEKWAHCRKQLDEQVSLVEIGERVRLRFLEQERLTYSKRCISRNELDHKKLEQGNEAAYGGNGIADAAVILSLERKVIDVESYRALFLDMYKCTTPEYHKNFPLRYRQALDLGISIRAGEGIHAGLGTEQQREEALEVVIQLLHRYQSLGVYSEAAAQDQEIDRLLTQAESLKAELVKSYNRRRNNRRRPRPAPTNYAADFGDAGHAGAAWDEEYAGDWASAPNRVWETGEPQGDCPVLSDVWEAAGAGGD